MKTPGNILIIVLLFVSSANAQTVSTRKYVNHTEVGGLFGRVKYPNTYNGNLEQVDNRLSLTAQMFNGIQVNRRLAAGLIVGMDWYRAALVNPIAGGVRYDLTRKGNVKVFGLLDAGYGFAWFHDDAEGFDTHGGVMINPGVGLRMGKDNGAGFTLAFTYKRQEISVDKPPLWDQTRRSEDRVYNRIAIRLGMSF
jgi:hypothetical protein